MLIRSITSHLHGTASSCSLSSYFCVAHWWKVCFEFFEPKLKTATLVSYIVATTWWLQRRFQNSLTSYPTPPPPLKQNKTKQTNKQTNCFSSNKITESNNQIYIKFQWKWSKYLIFFSNLWLLGPRDNT